MKRKHRIVVFLAVGAVLVGAAWAIFVSRCTTEYAIERTHRALVEKEKVWFNGKLQELPSSGSYIAQCRIYFINRTSIPDSVFIRKGWIPCPDLEKTGLLKFYQEKVLLYRFEERIEDRYLSISYSFGPTFGYGMGVRIPYTIFGKLRYRLVGIS